MLVFDYRGFGTSRRASRGRTSTTAVTARTTTPPSPRARDRDGVDPDRIMLWGSSYSGGHVVAVAAQDPRIAGVISQGAAMDGLAALLRRPRGRGTRETAALTAAGLRDVARALAAGRRTSCRSSAREGSSAVISAPGAESGYQAIMGPTFRNEMCARGILRIVLNRPVTLRARSAARHSW